MTFILTVGNREQFIQVSDRRLSWDGKPLPDESNKAGILLCRDARHIFAFTGLAKFESFDTRRWLLNALYECCPPDYRGDSIVERLKERATTDFSTLPALKGLEQRRKRLSIMFSGYNYQSNPPLSTIRILTNYQNFVTGKDSDEAWNHFEMNYWTEVRPLDHEFGFIQWIGKWTVTKPGDVESLRKLAQNLRPFQAIADKAVALVREFADRPKSGAAIGKQLSVVVLHRDRTEHVLSRYYSTVAGHKMYVPDEIVGFSDTERWGVADREVWIDGKTGPEVWALPKVHKNAPCPCKSGEKYKNCHGRRPNQARAQGVPQPSENRVMRVTASVRRERSDPSDVLEEEFLQLASSNWPTLARMAYGEFVVKGRGALFINLNMPQSDTRGTFFTPIYVADGSEDLRARGGWPKGPHRDTADLVATYDPKHMVVFIFAQKDGTLTTTFMGTNTLNSTPKHLYETGTNTGC